VQEHIAIDAGTFGAARTDLEIMRADRCQGLSNSVSFQV
jgi:hypothetical protein